MRIRHDAEQQSLSLHNTSNSFLSFFFVFFDNYLPRDYSMYSLFLLMLIVVIDVEATINRHFTKQLTLVDV